MRDRSKVINIEISENAKKIYDNLPSHVKKGQYVSEAIEEKNSRDNGTDEIAELKKEIKRLHDDMLRLIEIHERDFHRR